MACGSDQLYAGLSCGIERLFILCELTFSVRILRNSLNSDWGVLLVDVSNAFNSSNCTAMLLHTHVLWPC